MTRLPSLIGGALAASFFMSVNVHASWNLDAVVNKIGTHSCPSLLSVKPFLLVVGLGNRGYEGTRHNVGADTLRQLERSVKVKSITAADHWLEYNAEDEADASAFMDESDPAMTRRKGLTIEYKVGGRVAIPAADSQLANVIFVYPYYDINESGHFVAQLAKDLKLPIDHIVVLVDDFMLARNQLKLSFGKVDGKGDKHNGLKSLDSALGSGAYLRLRTGVSNPEREGVSGGWGDWVLSSVPKEDRSVLFSKPRIEGLSSLLLNLQARLAPRANKEKLSGEGGVILKQINKKE